MQPLLLGIDVGTTAVKAALFEVDGRVMSVGNTEYPTKYIRAGWVEQNPDDWWQATCTSIQAALKDQPEAAKRVAGVAVSAQAPTMLPVDAEGTPLHAPLIWMDRRAEPQAQQLGEMIGFERVYAITGNRPDPYYVAAKIRWLGQHHPDLLARTHKFLQITGYINYRLTGEFSLDMSHSGLLQLIDHHTGEWSAEMLDACGVTPAQFPTPQAGHLICGEVTPGAAEQCWLRAGTSVMVGTVDGTAAALEAGITREGVAAEMTGTSTVMMMPTAHHSTDISMIALPHAVEGVHLLLGAMVASGASLRWFRDEFGADEVHLGGRLKLDPYDLMTQQAATVSAGSEGVIFLPYMMGERSPIWNTNARGVFFGLSLSTPRAALIRAILEGVAMGMRHNIDVAQAAGIQFDEIRAVGGGSSSALWNQIKADVLGIPVAVPETSVGAPFGDALLVGLGAGIYDDVNAFIDNAVKVKVRYEPDVANHERYTALYDVFRSVYEHLRPDFDAAAAIFEDDEA